MTNLKIQNSRAKRNCQAGKCLQRELRSTAASVYRASVGALLLPEGLCSSHPVLESTCDSVSKLPEDPPGLSQAGDGPRAPHSVGGGYADKGRPTGYGSSEVLPTGGEAQELEEGGSRVVRQRERHREGCAHQMALGARLWKPKY